nr:uncharacterized protein LOC129387788 [Dermacentor andersoni]
MLALRTGGLPVSPSAHRYQGAYMIEYPGAPFTVATPPEGDGRSAASLVHVDRRPREADRRSIEEGSGKTEDNGLSFLIVARIVLAALVLLMTAALLIFGLKGRSLFRGSTTTTTEPQLKLYGNS